WKASRCCDLSRPGAPSSSLRCLEREGGIFLTTEAHPRINYRDEFTELNLAHNRFQRRPRRRIKLPGHPSSEVGVTSGKHRMLHGFRHKHRVLSICDSRVH